LPYSCVIVKSMRKLSNSFMVKQLVYGSFCAVTSLTEARFLDMIKLIMKIFNIFHVLLNTRLIPPIYVY